MNSIKIFLLLSFLLSFSKLLAFQEKPQVKDIIIDLDSSNEVDDLYALARILLDSNANVTAINATHWQTAHWAVPNTMEISHRLNQQLLSVLDLNCKTNRGGAARMYDWGDRAQHSAAAYDIIAQAGKKTKGDKISIIALGALTNVASALYIDSTISEKIQIYWLGSTYDFKKGIFTYTDFNSVMDIYALQYLLHAQVEMHILPLNVARAMKVNYQRLKLKFEPIPVGRYLIKRWDDHLDPLRKERILWDLALVEAFLHPELAQTLVINMSKDNGGRKINFYTMIDNHLMMDDFEHTILNTK